MFSSVILVSSIGLTCGVILSIAAKLFAVQEDPRVKEIEELLPGANCGACGFASCHAYAEAIVEKGADINLCSSGGLETAKKIGDLMDLQASEQVRKVALVLCAGDDNSAAKKALYNGIADCKAAALVAGGDKACPYGCLGLGTCERVCPVNAISMKQGVAVVDPQKCIGCGLCVESCPRHLIKLVPDTRTIHILCSSPERGAKVRKVCTKGCIGCGICAKATDAINMEGSLAVVDYTKDLDIESIIEKCPQKTIVKLDLKKK
jgi:Na+-translocating ferredoxin:NAD+ oxidoreductase subunit B